jgi:hypothetical protein
MRKIAGTTTKVYQLCYRLDGAWVLGIEVISWFNYCSYTIWVDCPIEEAILRGKHRDRYEYGVPQEVKWEGIWKDNDIQCFNEFLPKNNANYVLDNRR